MKIDVGVFCLQCGYEMTGTAGTADDNKFSLGFQCDACEFVIEVRIYNRGSQLNLE